MKVDFMRKVDRYAGTPICFTLSIMHSIGRLFGGRKNTKPKKILFIELSEMGSTILAYGAMKKAKELFNAEIYFMIFKENEQSVKLLNLIPEKNIITIRSKSFRHFFVDTFKAIHRMRKEKIDTVIDLELFSRFTSILCFFSGAKNNVGFYRYNMEGLYRGNFQTHKVQYNPYYHISQNFMSLIYSLKEGIIDKDRLLLKDEIKKSDISTAKIISSDKERANIIEKLQKINPRFNSKSKLVLLNPNASELLPIRKWPIENYMKLAKELLKDNEVFIGVTGVVSEREDALKIINYVKNDRCIDLTGKTTLRELIDLYNISSILITNDSGPAHFASLTDINIIVFFGPETPKLYSPLSNNFEAAYSNFACSPCVSAFNHRKTACTNNRCLQAIKPESVVEIARRKI